MRALHCRTFGGPEDLVIDEVQDPLPGPDQVVVDVHACALAFPDLLAIQNRYQGNPTPPFSPGSEIAGVVTAVGPGVESRSIGDRVFAVTSWGGLAERACVNSMSCIPIPENIGYIPASAFLYAYGTSHYALEERAALKPGETLVVLGASGGVGLAAVELGALLGARVIAAASTQAKLQLCTEHGASMTINYCTEDLKNRIRQLTDGRGADVVLDAVGGPYSEPALRSVAWYGRFLVVGFAGGAIPSVALNLPLLKSCQIVGVQWGAAARRDPTGHRRRVDRLLQWWQAGALKPHISAVYPLEHAGDALRQLADRRVTGKIVISVRPG